MTRESWREGLRWPLAAVYLVAGVFHLKNPGGFLPIVPGWVPFPRETVIVTGACEVAGATALLTRRWRWWAGTMLAAYAVCVYPANIRHAVDRIVIPGIPDSLWYHVPRLMFQPVFVWWALFAGRVIDWPFRGTARPAA